MNTKTAFLVTLFFLNTIGYSQSIYIVTKQAKECDLVGLTDISLLVNFNDKFFQIYTANCKEEQQYFTFSYYIEVNGGNYYVFEEYFTEAGLGKVHYFDIQNKIFYSSDFYDPANIVPIESSFDAKELFLQGLSINVKNCGETLSIEFKKTSNYSKVELSNYHIIKKIK